MPRTVQPARRAWRLPRAPRSTRRISEQTDTNDAYNNGTADGQVDSSDPVFFIFTDLQGRRLATSGGRGTDTYPKETFIHHAAGLGGPHWKGGPLLRDRDGDCSKPENWSSQAANSTRTERRYYAGDFRGNVTALVTDTGELAEQYRYSATGVPFGIPLGDVTSDGLVQGTNGTADYDELTKHIGGTYEVRFDLDLDGDVDTTDRGILANQNGDTTGRGELSVAGVHNPYCKGDCEFVSVWSGRLAGLLPQLPTLAIDMTNQEAICKSRPIMSSSAIRWNGHAGPVSCGSSTTGLASTPRSAESCLPVALRIDREVDTPWGPATPGVPPSDPEIVADPCYPEWLAKQSAEKNWGAAMLCAMSSCMACAVTPNPINCIACASCLVWVDSAIDGMRAAELMLRRCCLSMTPGRRSALCAWYMTPIPVFDPPPGTHDNPSRPTW